MLFQGDYGGLLILDLGQDTANMSNALILYTKPDGTSGSWPGILSGTTVQYTIQIGDIDQTGLWLFQPEVQWLNQGRFHGTIAPLQVDAIL